MAITFSDKVHNVESTASPVSFSFTNNASTNALLVLNIEIRDATARAGGAPTYNGVALTQAGTTTVNASGNSVSTWYLVAPATGANTLSIPNTGGLRVSATASSWNNCAQSSVVNATNNATGTGTAPSVSVTSVGSRCLIVGGMAHENKNASTNDQGTVLFITDEGQWNNGETYVIQTSPGAQTLSWTSGSDFWSMHIVAFNPYVQQQTLTASAGTTATLSKVSLYKRTLSTAATMLSAIARQLSLTHVLSAVVVTVPTLAKFVSIFKTFSTAAVTVVALERVRTYSRTLSTTAGTAASLATLALHKISMATIAATVTTLTRFSIRFKTLTAAAGTSAAMFTKGVALVLRNAAGALVANTLVKWGIMEYGGGAPSDANFMSMSDKGTDWTDGSGNLQVPYSGASAKGATVYVAVVHPDDTPTESMIWTDTIK